MIVGFPGETDAHFEETVELIRQEPIDYVHVFSYSQRQMAKSRSRGDSVSSSIISKRSQVLRELSLRKRRIFYDSLVWTTQTIIIEDIKGDYWVGLTDNYVRVKVKASGELMNQMIPVKLQRIEGSCLIGEI